MRIERFEDLEAWKLSRELCKMVYGLTKNRDFSRDNELKGQIRAASGSSMHNVAEGFDADSVNEFVRFLRYSQRSCTEVQSELYVALDQEYISDGEFRTVYDHAGRTRAVIRGLIRYLLTRRRPRQRTKDSSSGNVSRNSSAEHS